MSSKIYRVFKKKGFVTFESFKDAVDDLTIEDPRGLALTLVACYGSIKRALDLLERRAAGDAPALHMVHGLQGHVKKVWARIRPENAACSLSIYDISRWRHSSQPEQITVNQLADLRILFLDFSRVVECMHLLAKRLVPERRGEDFNRFVTPFLLFAYLLGTEDSLPPEMRVQPKVSVVSEEALDELMQPLRYQYN